MLHKEMLTNGQRVRVTFELPGSLWATTIALVGDFNDWDPQRDFLRQRMDGAWTVSIELPAGHAYQFRYLLDGKDWCNDWHADGQSANAHGAINSVVVT